MTKTQFTAITHHAFVPADMPVARRAQLGAMVSQLRANGYENELRGVGARVAIPAGMNDQQAWEFGGEQAARIARVLTLAGAVVEVA